MRGNVFVMHVRRLALLVGEVLVETNEFPGFHSAWSKDLAAPLFRGKSCFTYGECRA